MVYNSSNKFNLSPHPFKTQITESSKYLVIGTFPTYKRNFEFYYSGEGNRFWFVMGKVFGKSFKEEFGPKAKKEREMFLEDHLIGITDMHEVCYRKGISSGDENLYSVILTDIIDLIERNKKIDTLVFTSRTDAIGALGLFKILLIRKGIEVPALTSLINGVLYGKLKIGDRTLDLYVPFSPSKRLSEVSDKKLITMYGYVFSD